MLSDTRSSSRLRVCPQMVAKSRGQGAPRRDGTREQAHQAPRADREAHHEREEDRVEPGGDHLAHLAGVQPLIVCLFIATSGGGVHSALGAGHLPAPWIKVM